MILSIDPSIRHLGWATKDGSFWEHGTINLPQRENSELPKTLIDIAVKLKRSMGTDSFRLIDALVVEYPEFHGGTKGATAAVMGSTFGLAAIAGFLQGYFKVPAERTFFYKPSEWKGQVPKEGMEYRFKKKFGYAPKTDHEAEAALLLDYHINK